MQSNNKDADNFYLHDSRTGKFFKLTRMSYRRQLAAMISEDPELRREVMNKVYDYEEIPELIEKYNKWCSIKR